MNQPHLRLRKMLNGHLESPIWPDGISPGAFDAVAASEIHAVLDASFPGLVAPCPDWYGNLTHDDEFDISLCVPALTLDGGVAGFVQCWTSNFIKDLAVAPEHRGKGVGEALMRHSFALFAQRGAPYVDLKVQPGEMPARRLYQRLGLVEVTAADT